MLYSVWSEYFHCKEMTLAEKAAAFAECGFFASELSDEDGARLLSECPTAAEAGKKVRTITEDTGFQFPQGHLWLSACITGDDYETKFDRLKAWFDMYLEAGIPRAVLHANSRPGQSYAVARARRMVVLDKVAAYLRDTNLTVCIENIFGGDHAESSGLLALMHDLGSPNFGICLDTGHLNMHGETQLDFIRACGKYLKALHLADNQGKEDQHMMPFGRGNVDFFSVVRGLREVGYDGLFNYEIPGENSCPLEVRKWKLRYLHQVTDYLIANA
ncbi:MAG: sugar phosphate isomerase/epimerase family protein [Clostridiaceae bacterium]|nr:sugar phosphate isomerase/epimerase family protein [Clostridiaceae bacterium]